MTRAISGIYSITNVVNQKRYYGSSVNVWGRKRQHVHGLRHGNHRNKHLQAAWNLYGEDSFVFSLVQEAPTESLLDIEQSHLDRNQNGYNIAKCAASSALGIKWSLEARQRLSCSKKGLRLSEEHKKALSLAGKGRRVSDDSRRRISDGLRGRKLTSSTKEKISSAVQSLWEDDNFRSRLVSAQNEGRQTEEAKLHYSTASSIRWANPEYVNKMIASRKSLWQDPAFREKMIEIRKIQGQELRKNNKIKQEKQNALQE